MRPFWIGWRHGSQRNLKFWINAARASNIRLDRSSNGWGKGIFLTRRIENVRGEFSLTALAYNIRRALTLVGVIGLMQAIRA
jgi:hypothetical protein